MIKPTFTRHSLSKLTRLCGTATLSLLALSLAACEPELTEVEADVPIPEEQAGVPEDAEVGGDDATADVSDLMGETVTVSTKITEVLSPNLFTVYDIESLRGEEMLAITNIAIPEVGTNVEVTGEIMELDETTIKTAYDVTLEPDVAEAYADRPYLAVKGLEAVD